MPCPPGETYNRSIKACRPKRKPGRKAKDTIKCAPGETYNTSLKACRPKKKPGPKTKKNSPMKKPEEVTIVLDAEPEMHNDGSGIISWYTKHGYLQYFFENFAQDEKGTMTFNKASENYEIRFIPNESWPKDIKEQRDEATYLLGNPDDDGNYPIDVHGEEFFVHGDIRAINGVEFYEFKDVWDGKKTYRKLVPKPEYNDLWW